MEKVIVRRVENTLSKSLAVRTKNLGEGGNKIETKSRAETERDEPKHI